MNMSHGLILNENILLGTGADNLSGVVATGASKNNHSVAYIVPYNSWITREPNVFDLSQKNMLDADEYILRADKNIHRGWPVGGTDEVEDIRRDCYIVRWCQRVYAVGTFVNDNSLLKLTGNLAWAAQMYVDRFLYDHEPIDNCEIYLFDLTNENWYKWTTTWKQVEHVPQPKGIYAVIGSKILNLAAKQAIDNLWNDKA